jgi:hypothetical protein
LRTVDERDDDERRVIRPVKRVEMLNINTIWFVRKCWKCALAIEMEIECCCCSDSEGIELKRERERAKEF